MLLLVLVADDDFLAGFSSSVLNSEDDVEGSGP